MLAISGVCKNASLFSGLKRPDVRKFFSTTIEISDPIFFFLKFFQNFFLNFHLLIKAKQLLVRD